MPGARQEGRADVVAAYQRQFADSATRSFKVEDLRRLGRRHGPRERALRRDLRGDPDVTGTITFGILRDRGTPRIALISARQDG